MKIPCDPMYFEKNDLQNTDEKLSFCLHIFEFKKTNINSLSVSKRLREKYSIAKTV